MAGEFYEDEKPYLELVDSLKLKNVHMHTQFIPNDEVANYFSAADLVVQPYKTATQSGVSQVAYHFELPMVVTNVGGLASLYPKEKRVLFANPIPLILPNLLRSFLHLKTKLKCKQILKNLKSNLVGVPSCW